MPSKPRIPFKISEPSSSCFASSSPSLGSVLLPLQLELGAPVPRPAVCDHDPVEAPVAHDRHMQDHRAAVKRGREQDDRASEAAHLPQEETNGRVNHPEPTRNLEMEKSQTAA